MKKRICQALLIKVFSQTQPKLLSQLFFEHDMLKKSVFQLDFL
jgi:hypothetical protein